MVQSPYVSIVLPTYNGSRYIKSSIQSCLDQTYQNWELILVDDASTDETPAILSAFAADDTRIHIIRNPQNARLPGALNIGFAHARGDYFTWTSDDNLYRPTALAELVQFLDARPDIDMVYSDCMVIDETGTPISPWLMQDKEYLALGKSTGGCFMYRRQVHEVLGGYTEQLYLSEDFDFWLRASIHFQMYHLPKDLYLYRRHRHSLTAQHSESALARSYESLRRHLPHLPWLTSDLRAHSYIRMAKIAWSRNEPSETRAYLLAAMRHRPRILASPVIFDVLLYLLFDRISIFTLRKLVHIRKQSRAQNK